MPITYNSDIQDLKLIEKSIEISKWLEVSLEKIINYLKPVMGEEWAKNVGKRVIVVNLVDEIEVNDSFERNDASRPAGKAEKVYIEGGKESKYNLFVKHKEKIDEDTIIHELIHILAFADKKYYLVDDETTLEEMPNDGKYEATCEVTGFHQNFLYKDGVKDVVGYGLNEGITEFITCLIQREVFGSAKFDVSYAYSTNFNVASILYKIFGNELLVDYFNGDLDGFAEKLSGRIDGFEDIYDFVTNLDLSYYGRSDISVSAVKAQKTMEAEHKDLSGLHEVLLGMMTDEVSKGTLAFAQYIEKIKVYTKEAFPKPWQFCYEVRKGKFKFKQKTHDHFIMLSRNLRRNWNNAIRSLNLNFIRNGMQNDLGQSLEDIEELMWLLENMDGKEYLNRFEVFKINDQVLTIRYEDKNFLISKSDSNDRNVLDKVNFSADSDEGIESFLGILAENTGSSKEDIAAALRDELAKLGDTNGEISNLLYSKDHPEVIFGTYSERCVVRPLIMEYKSGKLRFSELGPLYSINFLNGNEPEKAQINIEGMNRNAKDSLRNKRNVIKEGGKSKTIGTDRTKPKSEDECQRGAKNGISTETTSHKINGVHYNTSEGIIQLSNIEEHGKLQRSITDDH